MATLPTLSRPQPSFSSSAWQKRFELTLLLADADQEKYERAAVRWHVRFVHESKNVGLRESLAVLVLLAAIPVDLLAATARAELLSRRRGLGRPGETLVAWARRERG
jgi:hypothetical protein